MNDEARAAVGHKHERILLLAGLVGLAASAFTACGSSSADDSAAAGTAGTAGASSAGATSSGGSAGTTGSAGTSSSSGGASAGAASLGCTATADTAANTAAVVAAANALSALLTTDQKTTIQLDYSLENAEQWSNLPTTAIPRNGLMMGDMAADAQAAAVALVNAAGTAGATLFTELREADEWLVTDGKADASSYGDGRYYFAFLGTPSTSTPWILQVAGHHLSYNFTYNGACTSATPLFDGVEPTSWTDSDNTTHTPLEAQRAASVAVIAAIADNPDAVLSGTYTDIVNGPTNSGGKGDTRYFTALTYPTGTSDRGVLVGGLSTDAQKLVKTAIEAWVNNAAEPTATALLADYESDDALTQTYVAYSGAADLTTKNSYFRIDGPRVWIEYTIQGGIVYQNRVHFHTIWRDKAADYGAEFADAEGTAASSGGSTGMGMGPVGGGGPGGPPGSGGSN